MTTTAPPPSLADPQPGGPASHDVVGAGRLSAAFRPGRLWLAWVGLDTVLALAVRIATVLGRPNRSPTGDPFSYHFGANLLAEGFGFIDPWLYYGHNLHLHYQSAEYPPLFMGLLAISSLVGFKSFFAHRIWSCVIGAAGVPIAAYLGRDVMGGGRQGRRVGVLVGLIVAMYPNIWMSNEQVMSETIDPLVVGLVLLTAYRFWRRPRVWNAVAFGVALGVAALGRDELSLLTLIALPLMLGARAITWRARWGRLGLAAAAFCLVVGPWVGFNMVRFDKPVFISTGLGNTLASADCTTTFSGSKAGYWSLACALAAPHYQYQDASVTSAQAEAYAMRFIRAHESALPRIIFDREGRTFAFWNPTLQIRQDASVETRPFHWAEVGLYSYYALLVLSIPAVIALRRRRIPIYPLLFVLGDVAISVAITLGQTRYRSPFELCVALTGAIGLELTGAFLWNHRPRRPRPGEPVPA
ncbi:MAG TPA: glycosyltransferase family 39 protein [Acidimicrobiales bacterium]|nr:glycosyltransferase family 39 protein [Acidimicrobiales bacterium]